MREKIIAIGCTSTLVLIALYLRSHFYPQPSYEVHYYFTAFFSTAGLLIVIWSVAIFRQQDNKNRIERNVKKKLYKQNRRVNYRIAYFSDSKPIFNVEKCNENSNKSYLLDILNLSENGAQILHNGLLKYQDIISGYIVFDNGDQINISGKIVRISGSKASLQFVKPLPEKTLINEQRRLLSPK